MRWFVKYLGFGSYAVACFACGSSEPSLEPVAQQVQPIVGGVVDTPQENDAVVMIYAGTSIFGGGLCTGALIAPNVVLTARHCVSKTTEYVDCYQDVISDLDPQTLLIMRGYDAAHNPQGKLAKGKHIVHDGSTSLCGHDLALIVLDKDDVTGETQSQIPIVPLRVRVNKGPEIGEVFTAVGYGLTDPKDMNSSGVRYRRDGVKVLRFVMGTGDADFTGTQSICQGDSGGPAISANHAVIGVTSRGLNCMG
ncbi:MAG TPA: S1 family peptidase, partial [Polyangiaceae bacterium]|nr:S1 family peptidase [Polyangiaceae bacterium]